MKTYLLAWNPKEWEWTNLDQYIVDLVNPERMRDRWSCGNTTSIQPGDRFFLVRLVQQPRGIMGSARVESPV